MTEKSVLSFEDYLMKGTKEILAGKALANVPQNKFEEIYALAYMLYQQKLYHQSSIFFRLLAASRPSEPKFWKSLGASLQMEKNYEEALNCYLSYYNINPQAASDPYFFIHIADCHIALNEIEEGLMALDSAHALAVKSKNNPIVQHVAFMKEQWTQKTNNK